MQLFKIFTMICKKRYKQFVKDKGNKYGFCFNHDVFGLVYLNKSLIDP